MSAICIRPYASVDQRNILKLEFVDDQYALKFADKLLATRVIGAFGLLAFVIAAAGIYGVMAFLVAHRAHEIGIRIALGADASRINRLVMGSSLRLVLLGAALGNRRRDRGIAVGRVPVVRRARGRSRDARAGHARCRRHGAARDVASRAAGDADRSESAVEKLGPAKAGRANHVKL